VSLEQDLRRVVAEGERTLPRTGQRTAYKEALAPQYRLLLNLLTRPQPTTVARVDDYLRVIGAIREPNTLAGLEEPPADPPTLEWLLTSPLRILSSRLTRLPGTTVLIIETGAELLTLCAIRGGVAPLEGRIVLTRAPAELVNATIGLIGRHRHDIERIARKEPLDAALYQGLKAAGGAGWAALPEGIRSSLAQADTILYLPSAFGQLSELPVELWWTGTDWLGATRAIARFPSLRTLVETLSPNRFPARLDPRGYIIRATQSDDLTHAEREINGVTAALQAMALEVNSDLQPRIGSVRQAFDEGFRALHFVGHGSANPLGESLPIGKGDTLGPADFSQLGGARTPFAFLNVCEVGRARVGAAGGPAGFATRLVEKGAPAVIACLQEVPDRVATDIAIAFYQRAADQPVGRALSHARAAMDAVPYPPSCWGAYVLYGDPLFGLAGAGPRVRQARDLTLGWPDHVARFLATRSAGERQAALNLLALERGVADPAKSLLLDRATAWVSTAFAPASESYEERLALCLAFANSDAAAAGSLRMLLAMECLEGLHSKASVLLEAHAGMVGAAALHDTIAWPAFACRMAGGAEPGAMDIETKPLLHEAEGMLDAWALSEPAVIPLLNQLRKRGRTLSR
jgi:hypothetical protein